MILADLEIEGQVRKVIMQAPKNGFFYVIDRETGEFISGKNFVNMTWATGIDPETGRPIEVPEARYGGKAPVFQLPGPLGAHNWHPMSFSPDTGLVYIPAQEAPWAYGDFEKYEYKPGQWNTGSDFALALLPTDRAQFKGLKSMLKGRLLAWDPVKQEPAWAVEHGGPWNGGILSTAGNLVFQGTSDAHFAAYNAETGVQKWNFFSQTGIGAAPITYEIDGEQYIAVASGWGGAYVLGFGGVLPSGSAVNVGRVLVFKAGADGTLPELNQQEAVISEIPAQFADESTVKQGQAIYANRCAICHGDHAFASGLTPNLRYSAALSDAEFWQEIIIDGILVENGMPKFKGLLSKDEIESVRAYVVEEANNGLDKDFYDTDLIK
jgi:quinohemoprotein ethanol dehydrogenase